MFYETHLEKILKKQK